MGKIKIPVCGDSLEKTRRASELELVPSHVGELDGGGKGTHGTREELEASEFGGFVAGFVKSLQAEADAEKGNATLNGIEERRAESTLV
jgi:hypothetical protein